MLLIFSVPGYPNWSQLNLVWHAILAFLYIPDVIVKIIDVIIDAINLMN